MQLEIFPTSLKTSPYYGLRNGMTTLFHTFRNALYGHLYVGER
jgi:hypothetical protein